MALQGTRVAQMTHTSVLRHGEELVTETSAPACAMSSPLGIVYTHPYMFCLHVRGCWKRQRSPVSVLPMLGRGMSLHHVRPCVSTAAGES